MSDPAAILVIEDEPHTRVLLQVTLGQEGYQCLHASTGIAGVAAAVDQAPQVVLLDLGLPDLDGVEVTRRIREQSDVPVIVISARDKEADKIAALDGGANDYITKPFVAGELLARIRVALRYASRPHRTSESGKITIGDLSIDFDMRQVRMAGNDVHLTPIEYRLLSVMVLSADRVVSQQQLLQQVWGPRYAAHDNYLRVYMKKLRYKIEPEPARPRYLINVAGVGYRLRHPPE
jgi:two-component system KDP operon response regulator KdpE